MALGTTWVTGFVEVVRETTLAVVVDFDLPVVIFLD